MECALVLSQGLQDDGDPHIYLLAMIDSPPAASLARRDFRASSQAFRPAAQQLPGICTAPAATFRSIYSTPSQLLLRLSDTISFATDDTPVSEVSQERRSRALEVVCAAAGREPAAAAAVAVACR